MLECVSLQTSHVITKLPARTVLWASISNGIVKDSVCQDWGAQIHQYTGWKTVNLGQIMSIYYSASESNPLINKWSLERLSINTLNASVVLIYKPVNSPALHISWQVSLWEQHWRLMGKDLSQRIRHLLVVLLTKLIYKWMIGRDYPIIYFLKIFCTDFCHLAITLMCWE